MHDTMCTLGHRISSQESSSGVACPGEMINTTVGHCGASRGERKYRLSAEDVVCISVSTVSN